MIWLAINLKKWALDYFCNVLPLRNWNSLSTHASFDKQFHWQTSKRIFRIEDFVFEEKITHQKTFYLGPDYQKLFENISQNSSPTFLSPPEIRTVYFKIIWLTIKMHSCKSVRRRSAEQMSRGSWHCAGRGSCPSSRQALQNSFAKRLSCTCLFGSPWYVFFLFVTWSNYIVLRWQALFPNYMHT